jgi:hypothetical protein
MGKFNRKFGKNLVESSLTWYKPGTAGYIKA